MGCMDPGVSYWHQVRVPIYSTATERGTNLVSPAHQFAPKPYQFGAASPPHNPFLPDVCPITPNETPSEVSQVHVPLTTSYSVYIYRSLVNKQPIKSIFYIADNTPSVAEHGQPVLASGTW